jgi:cell fate regulator YaaT (PSP1 superfamily)
MSLIDLPVIQAPSAPKPPATLVVRYGQMRMIGEFAYDGDVRPGCGAKVVIRTKRGVELAEILTTTCTNGGCAKSVSREKIADYIEESGGNEYPFSTDGRVIRIATPEDLAEQKRLEGEKPQYVAACKTMIREMDLPMKLVDVEMLLGGEMVTFFFLSEHRVDFRGLVKHLASRFHTRIQMHQVGARDEARLVADFETCGQHCCCKQFLKVLKPVNMGAAKMQKATLDPNKISGRCGRLKCCLRYEEQSYEELRRLLPRIGSRVRTGEGVGMVVETMILTQLVKVRLDSDRFVAVANEEIVDRDVPESAVPAQKPVEEERPRRGGELGNRGGDGRAPRREPAPLADSGPAPFELFVDRQVQSPNSPAEPPVPRPPAITQGPIPAPPTASPDKTDPSAMGRRRRGRGRGRGGPEGPPQA